MSELIAVIKIIRPINIIITFFSIVVAAIICSNGNYNSGIIVLAALSGSFAAASGNTINDIFDVEIDKINRPDRPLTANLLTRFEAFSLFIFFVVASLILALLVNMYAFCIDCSALVLLFFYSYSFKRIILFGNFIVAFLTGLAFIYGGIAVNSFNSAIVPAVFALLINLIREIVKDMEDIEGDEKTGLFSFPHLYGFELTKKLITYLSVFLIAVTFYPFIVKIYKIEYFILIMLLVNPVIIYTLKSLNKDTTKKNLHKISFILKLNMLFGLIAIFAGKKFVF
jgi:geranylgeranylglycerol-phosphate geranylgeranyltransferase